MPKKKLIHEHTLKQVGMTLWCKCGMSINIECAHKWTLHKKENISFEKMGGMVHQNQETHTCSVCGALLTVNTTTGTSRIIH